jgi:heme/copper-type cytochrome/quinol oxidase subunit 2
MWFRVKVVPPAAYTAWLAMQKAQAAKLSASAAGQAVQEQTSAGIPIRPDYGGGTN